MYQTLCEVCFRLGYTVSPLYVQKSEMQFSRSLWGLAHTRQARCSCSEKQTLMPSLRVMSVASEQARLLVPVVRASPLLLRGPASAPGLEKRTLCGTKARLTWL